MKSQHFDLWVTLESLIFLEFLCYPVFGKPGLHQHSVLLLMPVWKRRSRLTMCDWFCSPFSWRLWLREEARPNLLAAQLCLCAVKSLSGQGVYEADHIQAWHLEGYCQSHSQIMTVDSQGWRETSEPEGKLGENSKPWGTWGRGRQAGCWPWQGIFSRKASPTLSWLYWGGKSILATICTTHRRGEEQWRRWALCV